MTGRIEPTNFRPLNSGGRGDLYLAQLRHDGTFVVVKVLREAHLPHEKQAFLREIKILAMGLIGMVRLIAYNTDAERPYYVMEYLSGGALTCYAGRLTENQLLNVAIALAKTLGNFHTKAGGHGDIKPDNILVSHDGKLKLSDPLGNGPVGLDVGFSVLFSPDRGGTAGYWAPEVKNGAKVSPVADVYSYAATLYHLWTGRRPADGQQLDPTAYGVPCPEWLRQLIVYCSQSIPQVRPTMNEALRFLQGESWQTIYKGRQDRLLLGVTIAGLVWVLAAFLMPKSS
jgi:serine/threonine protein kinase